MEGFTKVSRTKGAPRRYFKYSETEAGTVLVERGVYLGKLESKFGTNFLFREEDGTEVCLNYSKGLERDLDENFETGDVAHIVFQGKEVMDGGLYAGKDRCYFDIYKHGQRQLSNAAPTESPSVVSKLVGAITGKTPVAKPAPAKPAARGKAAPKPAPVDDGEDFAL